VEWLGEVPEHWRVLQSRRLFRQRNERARANDEQLTASQRYGIVMQAGFMAAEGRAVVRVIHGADILKHVEPNDFVISMRSFEGGIEWSGLRGSISSAYVMLVPSTDIYPHFYRYLFKCDPYIQALQSTSNLVRDGQAMRFENFTQIDLPLPTRSEQRGIALFLDDETTKIDALIEEQRRLIALLKQKRQAVISHAVTKGLNPAVLMKDSGVEWLGHVPQGWRVLTAKRISKIFVPQRNKPELNSEGNGIRWITMEDMKQDEIRSSTSWVSEQAVYDGGIRVLPAGAIVASCVGNFGIASVNKFDVVINQQLQAFVPSSEVLAKFLRYCVINAKTYFEQIGTVATLVYVNQEGFENMPLALPPLEEQSSLVDFLDREGELINALTAKADQVIALLQERRSALISAAVTGKIDVRNYAPRETPSPEELYELA
jgi:type I restriction enzyme S subunit